MVCIDSAAGGWDGNGAEAGFMQRNLASLPGLLRPRHSGMRPLGRRPGIQHRALFWIPGSLALRKIDYVNFAQSSRPGMTEQDFGQERQCRLQD
jgi:hypothetical protein